MKIGDGVLFSLGKEELKDNIGIIIGLKEDKYVILNRNTYGRVYVVEKKYVENLDNVNKVRENIKSYYVPQIEELKSKLKTVTSEEKIQERVNKYNDIKNRIIKNCERIINCSDDDEFDNRLKEILKLKKQLNNIDLECGDIIRKQNGSIKYDIKNIERLINSSLNNISDERITKALEF